MCCTTHGWFWTKSSAFRLGALKAEEPLPVGFWMKQAVVHFGHLWDTGSVVVDGWPMFTNELGHRMPATLGSMVKSSMVISTEFYVAQRATKCISCVSEFGRHQDLQLTWYGGTKHDTFEKIIHVPNPDVGIVQHCIQLRLGHEPCPTRTGRFLSTRLAEERRVSCVTNHSWHCYTLSKRPHKNERMEA